MNYCSNCGTPLAIENKFCPNCGKGVTETKTAEEHLNAKSSLLKKESEHYATKPGFWGSVLLIAGFFLPWFSHMSDSSGYLLTKFGRETILYFLFPISGIMMLIHNTSTKGLPKTLVLICGLLPLAVFIFFIINILLFYNSALSEQSFVNVVGISDIGIGLWATLIGSVLIILEKSKKKTSVS